MKGKIPEICLGFFGTNGPKLEGGCYTTVPMHYRQDIAAAEKMRKRRVDAIRTEQRDLIRHFEAQVANGHVNVTECSARKPRTPPRSGSVGTSYPGAPRKKDRHHANSQLRTPPRSGSASGSCPGAPQKRRASHAYAPRRLIQKGC